MPRPSRLKVVSKDEVGHRIRVLRNERGWSQTRLAAILETTQSNISGLERGTRSLTVHQVVRLARALRCSTDQILVGTPPSKRGSNGFVQDRRFLRRLQQIDGLSHRKKQALLTTIDAFLGEERPARPRPD